MENIDIFFLKAMKSEMTKTTQKAISLTVGVSSGYITDIHSGKKRGSERVRRKIAKAFGYEYEDFLELGRVIHEGNNTKKIGKTTKKDSFVSGLTHDQIKVLQTFRDFLRRNNNECNKCVKILVDAMMMITEKTE